MPCTGHEDKLFNVTLSVKSKTHVLLCCIECHALLECTKWITTTEFSMFGIWVRSRRCGCLVTWFCYHMIAKPGNKTATPSWPDPYIGEVILQRKNTDVWKASTMQGCWIQSRDWLWSNLNPVQNYLLKANLVSYPCRDKAVIATLMYNQSCFIIFDWCLIKCSCGVC